MINKGLFSTFYIDSLGTDLHLDDSGEGRMATLAQARRNANRESLAGVWESFLKQALGFLGFVIRPELPASGLVALYDDWDFATRICIACLVEPGEDMDDCQPGRYRPGRLIRALKTYRLRWGILTNGEQWRLYSVDSAKPYEDYVELDLGVTLERGDQAEYALFEMFFHADAFMADAEDEDNAADRELGVYQCGLDRRRLESEAVLEERVKAPLLAQVDEVMQYLCNGFIFDTRKSGADYSEEERRQIFESAVQLLYRCLFLFYAESRRLLPSEQGMAPAYTERSIRALCRKAGQLQWGEWDDNEGYTMWQHLKGLINAVNDGDPEYGIIGYNGGLFDDENEQFLGSHRLRNDFLGRALYLLAFVEPDDGDREKEYPIPYEDLEVRHLGELYENILEFNVTLAEEDLVRRRTARGTEILLLSQTSRRAGDSLIRKGEVYFAETALERKQSGSYYTPEPLVAFLNHKTITLPLTARFDRHRHRFDEFLHEAAQARDNSLRQGAFQSAVALLNHFIRDEVLTFTVCDPAMGSGHFLVNAANRITDFIISLLSELPSMEGMTAEITVQPNYWRRLVTRHCIYGVDRNPLSTHLAKLSLWLNCFARDHKLTFLDHHLRCGNSLIGVRTFVDLTRPPLKNRERKKKNPAQLDLPTPTGLDEPLREATAILAHIAQADEDDTDLMKESFEEAHATARDRLAALADLRTAFFMGEIMKPPEYGRLFRLLVENQGVAEFEDPELAEIWQRVEELRRYHHFFHWLLEFADIFGPEGSGGFDATVGNPPWDIVKPNSQEFFSAWLPNFRSLKKQAANRAAKELMAANPAIADKWQAYCDGFAEQSGYFREQENYQHLGKGDINTFKLFLEQFFHLLKSGGHQGIVVPSGLYTDKGCQPLRELFFEHSRIDCLYCFENKKAIFNIHRSFKFVLFCTRKGDRTEEFRCAFMQHDPARLPAIEAAALRMRVDQVRRFSPETLSVMEFNDQRDINLTARIYGDWPLLGEKIEGNWNVKFRSELHMTNDSHLFKSEPTPWPLYEGKMIWQFDTFYEQPRYWLDYDEAVAALGENGWEAGKYRVGFRDIGRSTDERTLIAAVLPRVFHGNTIPTITPFYEATYRSGPKRIDALALSAFFCSFCVEYIIRQKVSAHMNYFYMNTLPIPRLSADDSFILASLFFAITARSARLTCTHESFAELWQSVFSENWTDPDFWYPPTAPIDTYGPRHEQEIRRRLRDQAPSLTCQWTPECGVHDRLPDRRDTGDRAQLRAEIDALVAHLYKLSRDDFSYILDTFLVLRRKEEKAFGEFMSKRKCLEEYDRIGQVLN